MRLFVAAWLPPDVLDRLEALPRAAHPGVRWTTRDQWHVTLRFLGDLDDPAPVVEALRAARLPGASMALGPATEALSRGVLVVPAAGLDALASEVHAATDALVPADDDGRPFHGHVTLARARQGSVRRLAGTPFAARVDVQEVALVRSSLLPGGARYEDLARFPTGGPPAGVPGVGGA